MPKISFRAPLTSAGANAAFIFKDEDDVKTGQLTFRKFVGDPEEIADIQQSINEIFDTQGTGEGDPNRKIYSSTEFIANGDSQKTAIEKLDAQVKINEDNITGIGEAFRLVEYISDSAYETANGTPTGGEIYYNSTTGKARYYDGVDSAWKVVGQELVGIQERLGVGDGSTVNFTLTNAPLSDETIQVYTNGVITEKTEYSYSAPTLTFNTAPPAGVVVYVAYLSEGSPASPIVSAGTNNVEFYVITPADVTAANFTLAAAPAEPTKVLVDVIGGTSQQQGADYTISGSTFDFSGLGLDGVLASGDVVRVQYFT